MSERARRLRLRASWQRSERYGVSPDEVVPAFSGDVDKGSLLYDCASVVLGGLQSALAGEPVSMMVADRDGLVLARLCHDPSIRRSLDRVHLAPGFSYAERDAGTNGLGLSLADRAPTLVRAGDHYCTELRQYTCAAVPVLDPADGSVAGSINLTTWADSSSGLLLALAQSAAGATGALMAARGGRVPPPYAARVAPIPRGQVLRVDGRGADPCVSPGWRAAVADAAAALAAGRVTAVVGEPGSGKSVLAALARRRVTARTHLLHVRVPGGGEPEEPAAWLDLWTPELAKLDTCVVVSGACGLSAWAAGELASRLATAAQPFVLTAPSFGALPEELAPLVDAVVEVPPLRERPEDILPLAHAVARRTVAFTPRAAAALTGYSWPGNAAQLSRVILAAADRATVIDLHHLDPEVVDDDGGRRLTRLERLERDEIVRCLAQPGQTVTRAAEDLGIGRATLYRKIAHYRITV